MCNCTYGCLRNVINLANSIIGVSILAMPYCFRKCGILLSVLLIIISGLLTRGACYLLLKAAIMARRRNFEFLAFHTFGSTGKLAVEIGIIGFLIGVCIAFFVVIGDIGPPLASEYLMLENTPNLRAEVLVILGLFVALPLGMLRKVDSLTSLSALSIAFYGCLVLKIVGEALPKLLTNEWWHEVNWWQPAGLLPCLPIFSMALSCQTQLFEFFDTLNDPSLKRMTTVVSGSVHLCSSVYILVGMFGYIAFFDKMITGNILLQLTPSVMTEFIKLGFILTVVISFPLCLFPCRTSLHSLLFKQSGVGHHDMGANFIPDHRFRVLTVSLVTVTIGIAIMLPNIEFVLGIIGSTIGTMICLVFPALIFIHDTNKNTTEKRMAQIVMIIGMFILIACTYSTLHESDKPHKMPDSQLTKDDTFLQGKITEKPFSTVSNGVSPVPLHEVKIVDKQNEEKSDQLSKLKKKKKKITEKKDVTDEVSETDQKRQEPPIPQEPEIKKATVDQNLDLDPQAFQKEDKELQKDVPKNVAVKSNIDESLKNKNDLDKQEELLRKLEAQQEEQKKILEEQKKVLEELKMHQESHIETKQLDSGLQNKDVQGNPAVQQISVNEELPKNNEHNLKREPKLSEPQLQDINKQLGKKSNGLELQNKNKIDIPKESDLAANKKLQNYQSSTGQVTPYANKQNQPQMGKTYNLTNVIKNIPESNFDNKQKESLVGNLNYQYAPKLGQIKAQLKYNENKDNNETHLKSNKQTINQNIPILIPEHISQADNMRENLLPIEPPKQLQIKEEQVYNILESNKPKKNLIEKTDLHLKKRETDTDPINLVNQHTVITKDQVIQTISYSQSPIKLGSSQETHIEKREMRKLLDMNSSDVTPGNLI